MQAEDANVIRTGCHGDLMLRSDVRCKPDHICGMAVAKQKVL